MNQGGETVTYKFEKDNYYVNLTPALIPTVTSLQGAFLS